MHSIKYFIVIDLEPTWRWQRPCWSNKLILSTVPFVTPSHVTKFSRTAWNKTSKIISCSLKEEDYVMIYIYPFVKYQL